MLDEAAKKRTADGAAVYRKLIAADITRTIGIPDNRYAGLISAGTFTHGHLGPEPLGELWRIAAPGAWCAFAIRTTHFDGAGFAAKFEADVAQGLITQPILVETNMYSPEAGNTEHANDRAYIITCRVAK
jgi:hypothetical protein